MGPGTCAAQSGKNNDVRGDPLRTMRRRAVWDPRLARDLFLCLLSSRPHIMDSGRLHPRREPRLQSPPSHYTVCRKFFSLRRDHLRSHRAQRPVAWSSPPGCHMCTCHGRPCGPVPQPSDPARHWVFVWVPRLQLEDEVSTTEPAAGVGSSNCCQSENSRPFDPRTQIDWICIPCREPSLVSLFFFSPVVRRLLADGRWSIKCGSRVLAWTLQLLLLHLVRCVLVTLQTLRSLSSQCVSRGDIPDASKGTECIFVIASRWHILRRLLSYCGPSHPPVCLCPWQNVTSQAWANIRATVYPGYNGISSNYDLQRTKTRHIFFFTPCPIRVLHTLSNWLITSACECHMRSALPRGVSCVCQVAGMCSQLPPSASCTCRQHELRKLGASWRFVCNQWNPVERRGAGMCMRRAAVWD